MAEVTTYAIADKDAPRRETSATFFRKQIASPAANQNDDIRIMAIPPGFIVYGATMTVSATLGASCTAQLRRTTTALTAATTAGGADRETQSVVDEPGTSTAYLNVLIAGAAISAAATLTVEGWLEKASD